MILCAAEGDRGLYSDAASEERLVSCVVEAQDLWAGEWWGDVELVPNIFLQSPGFVFF